MRTHCIADQPKALRHHARKLAFILQTRLPWHKNSTSPFGAMTGRGCSRTGQDVSKLGMTYFLRTFDEEGHSPFLAIPVFPVRAFRHGAHLHQ